MAIGIPNTAPRILHPTIALEKTKGLSGNALKGSTMNAMHAPTK